ncbi:MAG: ubiquinone/menaquinone biosynthesis methyltransferase [Vicinamibacterales bacterium]
MAARSPLDRAFDSPDAKRAYNRRLFATIAPRYDLITRLLSYGQDARWKRRLADIVRAEGSSRIRAGRPAPPRLLDLACGTGDVALSLAESHDPVGLDLTLPMLEIARRRAESKVLWIAGDMTLLPFADASFDVVTTSYGLRNVPALETSVREIARVLRPGGLLVSLDFNKPRQPIVRAIYLGYLSLIGSLMGLALHGDRDTYRYIPHSIRRYPGAEGVAALLRADGFEDVRIEPKLGGLMTIHVARRS